MPNQKSRIAAVQFSENCAQKILEIASPEEAEQSLLKTWDDAERIPDVIQELVTGYIWYKGTH
jgi:hypothetical protein